MHRQQPQQPRSMPLQMMGSGDPVTEIVEQPKSRDMRFRYECEGRTAGSIPGENSTKDNKTFPSIRVRNYQGTAVIVVSCVTKSSPHYPHPHSLVGKTAEYECKLGVCTYKVREASQVIQFPNLGIQCAKKKELSKAMDERKKIRVDPFRTGYIVNEKDIDLNAVRLCWQVFLPDETGKFTRIVQPVVSNIIYDKKSVNDLSICRIDRTFGSVRGGEEVFLLCEKVNKDDIEVRFYEEDEKGKLRWEGFGHFGPTDVHHQVAIVFKTPPYTPGMTTIPIENNREVKLHLRRPSTKDCSDSITFTFVPHYEDPDWIDARRKRKRPMLPASASAEDNLASGALGTLGTLQVADPVTTGTRNTLRQHVMDKHAVVKAEQTESAACLVHVPATVLGVEAAAPAPAAAAAASAAAAAAAQQSIHTGLSNLILQVDEQQPFVSYTLAPIDAAAQQSSGLPGLNSTELSAIMANQDLLSVMVDPTFFMTSQSLLEGDPMLSDARCMPTTQSQDGVDAATRDGAVSMNITGSFSTSIGTELDNLPPPAGAPYIGMGGTVSAGGETMSISSTTSLDILLNQLVAGNNAPIQQQQQHHHQSAPSAASSSLQQNRR